jgi:hypothetical protein
MATRGAFWRVLCRVAPLRFEGWPGTCARIEKLPFKTDWSDSTQLGPLHRSQFFSDLREPKAPELVSFERKGAGTRVSVVQGIQLNQCRVFQFEFTNSADTRNGVHFAFPHEGFMLLLYQSWMASRLFKSDIRYEDLPQELAITEQGCRQFRISATWAVASQPGR